MPIVVLVHIDFAESAIKEDSEELAELAKAAGATIAAVVSGKRSAPDAKLFIGSGKAQELKEVVAANKAELVIFNHPLSPGQERNLEQFLACRVLDRIGLILDIFAARARTFEGKLQVELAQLQHLSTRLVRGWTHLERQKGGIGLRGPGETQLETDRRLVRARIKTIKERLVKLRSQRDQSRKARKKADLFTVSLVGYTNAGKSTLFNALTGADVYVANQLFATLDPTLRRVRLPHGGSIVLVDTVGFIRHLPHDLVDAFQATLQETFEADLLLHVIDSNDPEKNAKIEEVNQILAEIGADTVPYIEVYNKIDLTSHVATQRTDEEGRPNRVFVSAQSGIGLDLLIKSLEENLYQKRICRTISIAPTQAKLRAALYAYGAVQNEIIDETGGWQLEIELPFAMYQKLAIDYDL